MWTQPVFDRTQEDVDYAKANYSLDLSEQFKAAQNFTDWNRLIGNMHHLANLLIADGYEIQLSTREYGTYTVKEWNERARTAIEIDARGRTAKHYYDDQTRGSYRIGDIPQVNQIQLIQDDLGKLRHALMGMMNYSVAEWDGFGMTVAEINTRGRTAENYYSKYPIPQLPYTHFQKINDLEEITHLLERIIDSVKWLFRVSGTFVSGQLSYLPHYIEPSNEFMTVLEFNLLARTVQEINDEGRTAADFYRRL